MAHPSANLPAATTMRMVRPARTPQSLSLLVGGCRKLIGVIHWGTATDLRAEGSRQHPLNCVVFPCAPTGLVSDTVQHRRGSRTIPGIDGEQAAIASNPTAATMVRITLAASHLVSIAQIHAQQ